MTHSPSDYASSVKWTLWWQQLNFLSHTDESFKDNHLLMEFIVLHMFRSIKISSGTDYKFWLLFQLLLNFLFSLIWKHVFKFQFIFTDGHCPIFLWLTLLTKKRKEMATKIRRDSFKFLRISNVSDNALAGPQHPITSHIYWIETSEFNTNRTPLPF